jgi:S-adenosylmethionine:tRNA ribosyltransferase-isomerase
MKVTEFDFPLPAEAIAQRPAVPRDSARLLEVGGILRDPPFQDHVVRDLPNLLRAGDLLVFNDTKVIPARLHGYRDRVPIEVTLLNEIAPGRWRALARRSRRLKPGHQIEFAQGFSATIEAKSQDGDVTLAFDRTGPALQEALEQHGTPPLPPYIKREAPDPRDRADYQTVFATRPGAIAAPTAGLHFTEALLARLDACGVRRTMITLHVGAGTFSPIKVEKVEDHVMHAEWGEIGAAAAEAIAKVRRDGGRVIAVGTTALRLIETAAAGGAVRPFAGKTALFIAPGFRFRAADMLITNFHLPCSSLFMLVCAFAGTDTMKRAYTHALGAGYRFYSYGDCCLLSRNQNGRDETP